MAITHRPPRISLEPVFHHVPPGFGDRLRTVFHPPVAGAIEEERKLRTEGACIWDSFRRLSWCKVLVRIIAFPFLQWKASKWQHGEDRETVRPRVLRWTRDGETVYGGTVERNQLRKGLQNAIERTRSAGRRNVPDENDNYNVNFTHADAAVLDHMNLTVHGRPIKAYVTRIIGAGLDHLSAFVARNLAGTFDELNEFSRMDRPKMFFDHESREIFISITTGACFLDGSSRAVRGEMVMRVSLKNNDIDVRVISVEAKHQ